MQGIQERLAIAKSTLKQDLPMTFWNVYDYVSTATSGFTDLSNYNSSDKIRSVIDTFLSKLIAFLEKNSAEPPAKTKGKSEATHFIDNEKTEKQIREKNKQVQTPSEKKEVSPTQRKEQSTDSDSDTSESDTSETEATEIQATKEVATGNKETENEVKQARPQSLPLQRAYTTPAKASASKRSSKAVSPEDTEEDPIQFSERLPEEMRFIRRFVSFNGKRKFKADYLNFINALQRAIAELRIRRTSAFASQIIHIQNELLRVYNAMGKSHVLDMGAKRLAEYKALIASQKVMPAVQLIKRYISLNGRFDVKHKARHLLNAFERMADKGVITHKDRYSELVDGMYQNLQVYVKGKKAKVLSISKAELAGLNGVLESCGCQMGEPESAEGLNGIAGAALPALPDGAVSSMELPGMDFQTLGFKGKYLSLIGDPCRGFKILIYGKPKMGKSFLCVDFASYLAHHHGRVLYVAREEGINYTLKQKITELNAQHPNLYITDTIPEDMRFFDYICFDSVNKLGLTPEDLQAISNVYPDKGFVYVFQSTKDGAMRGDNEFAHDVDSIIHVPEKGLAVQNGRFNQGGELRFFNLS